MSELETTTEAYDLTDELSDEALDRAEDRLYCQSPVCHSPVCYHCGG